MLVGSFRTPRISFEWLFGRFYKKYFIARINAAMTFEGNEFLIIPTELMSQKERPSSRHVLKHYNLTFTVYVYMGSDHLTMNNIILVGHKMWEISFK